jgi:hypothetical protein
VACHQDSDQILLPSAANRRPNEACMEATHQRDHLMRTASLQAHPLHDPTATMAPRSWAANRFLQQSSLTSQWTFLVNVLMPKAMLVDSLLEAFHLDRIANQWVH